MQLLHTSSLPNTEFASFSLLLKQPDGSNEESLCCSPLVDAVTMPSPTAVVSSRHATSSLVELHQYLRSVFMPDPAQAQPPTNKKPLSREERAAKNLMENGATINDATRMMYLDDRTLIDGSTVQVYHPSMGHGISLHYLLIRDVAVVQPFTSLILHRGTVGKMGSIVASPEAVTGVVLCVGVSGLSYAYTSCSIIRTLTQRMHDCVRILTNLGSSAIASNSALTEEECRKCARSVVSTLLLTDDEERKTNAMAEESNVDSEDVKVSSMKTPVNKISKKFNFQSDKRRLINTMKRRSTSGSCSAVLSLSSSLSSANLSRKASEHMTLISVSETDVAMRRYESKSKRRTSLSTSRGSRARRVRKGGSTLGADLDQFDFVPPVNSAVPTHEGGEQATRIKTPVSQASTAVVPTLSAPSRDVGRVRDARRANVQNCTKRWTIGTTDAGRARTGGQPPLNGNANTSFTRVINDQAGATARDAFLNSQIQTSDGSKGTSNKQNRPNKTLQGHFGKPRSRHRKHALEEDERSAGDMSTRTEQLMEAGARGNMVTDEEFARAMEVQEQQKRGGADEVLHGAPFDPFGGAPSVTTRISGDRTAATVTASSSDAPTTTSSPRLKESDFRGDSGRLPYFASRSGESGNIDFALDQRTVTQAEVRGEGGEDKSSENYQKGSNHIASNGESSVHFLVNIALNEDLTCSYKQSRMASCSIEGVVQVQVQTNAPGGGPFFLMLRDPSRHIRQIQENKKYANDVSTQIVNVGEDDVAIDHRYSVTVPISDSYYPIMRYKCSNELRPVPIRVQTRVRLHGIYCRVALQISSNPANEDDLTDLTIIMVVPPEVKGETLTTSPPGGVWNEAKRSVLWCVAELGDGEKFQLQAQFEMESPQEQASWSEREKLKFPVLVRCQCMYAQLSDIELEVTDLEDVLPAEVTMKLARRFRLSHREKS